MNKALSAAVIRLMRPLVRLMLRNGIPFGAFADLVKWVYVDVAGRDFMIEGRKQSDSRISVITGLSRKEVRRVRAIPDPVDEEALQRFNRAARVITGWVRDPQWRDGSNRPAALQPEGGKNSFADLVKKYSGDVPTRAIQDELLRVGAIRTLADGRLKLCVRAYVPSASEDDKLVMLGTDAADLIGTIEHNLSGDPDDVRYQRKVAYDNLPEQALPKLRKLAGNNGQRLLERVDQWLSEQDRDMNPDAEGTGRKRAGIGIYYFEQDVPEQDQEQEKSD